MLGMASPSLYPRAVPPARVTCVCVGGCSTEETTKLRFLRKGTSPEPAAWCQGMLGLTSAE